MAGAGGRARAGRAASCTQGANIRKIQWRAIEREIGAVASALGEAVRAERERRHLTLRQVAEAAGLGFTTVDAIESGRPATLETYIRIARALHLKPEFALADPHRRSGVSRAQDPVHSAMGEMEAAHFRGLDYEVQLDEPFQHFQFAGRGDVVAWSIEAASLLHIENKTALPNLQDAFGAFNSKRAYLGAELAARLGLKRWRSEMHAMALLPSSEILRSIRQHRASFDSLDRDGPQVFGAWWSGNPPAAGRSTAVVLLDPTSRRRDARVWVGIVEPGAARPRYRNYADALAALVASGQA